MVAVPVSAELMATLAAFDGWRERTGGALDASAEAAGRLWARAKSEGRVPTEAEIAETREAMGQAHWSLDREAGTAMRLSGTPLALATFAKSRITQAAADAALGAGAAGVTLNVGGDVVVRGAMSQMVLVADPLRDAENAAPRGLCGGAGWGGGNEWRVSAGRAFVRSGDGAGGGARAFVDRGGSERGGGGGSGYSAVRDAGG